MALDEELDVRPDRVAHRAEDRERPPLLGRRQLVGTRPEGVDLERPVAHAEDDLRPFGDRGRLALDGVPGVGVDRHALVDRPAEQPPRRHAEPLALDVEQRGGNGAHARPSR